MLSLRILLVAISIAHSVAAFAGPVARDSGTRMCIYIVSPLGMLTKQRVKIEFRGPTGNSWLIGLTVYYGINRGGQGYGEFRHYMITHGRQTSFWYTKAGGGISTTYNGIYLLAGGGIGQLWTFGKRKNLLFQLSEGLRACPPVYGDIEAERSSGFRGLFYLVGPGSVIDLNINIGVRF
jgi:hypothetical protein